MRRVSSAPGLAMAMAAFLAVGCSSGVNPEDQVSRELKDASIDEVAVDYDSNNNVVHLTGAVTDPGDSRRAEEIAARVVGTSGRVANEITVKGATDATADDMDGAIRRELNAKVDNDQLLAERDINFDVNNGVVTIKGQVRTEAEKDSVGAMAKDTANVRDVVNALTIDTSMRPADVPSAIPPTR